MKFSTFLVSLIGLAVAAPSPSKLQDIAVYDPVTRVISPIAGLEKRVNPQTPVGNIYRDKNGVVRAILVFQLTEHIIQAFENSGFNLAKDILSELLEYGRENNFVNQVRRNLWDAEFDATARILSDRITSFTLAITSRGSNDGVTGVTELIQSWMQQGNNYARVKEVTDALAINKRSVSDAPLAERGPSTSDDWCSVPIHGLFNLLVDKPANAVSLETGCPSS